jgi:sigma-B regulation protein RsbU (phosphoserine phosphatase)
MGDMVRVVSREGRVVFANESFRRNMAGGKDTFGDRCYDMYGRFEECNECVSHEVLATGKTRQLTRRMGDRIYSVTVSPLANHEGENFAAVEVFRDMTLDYNIKQNLINQNSKMQRDLQLARGLQQALVKNVLPTIPGYRMHAGFFPCEAVGGDIFDCLCIGDKCVMYVADVCGHGVMPAMLAVFFSWAVRSACQSGREHPSDILRYVQKEFLEINLADTIYITSFIVAMDTATGRFEYSNADLSVVPVVYDGGMRELYMSAPPLSRWFENPGFQDADGVLGEGCRLLIYSDGLNGIHNDEKVKNRLYELFASDDFECEKFVGNVHGNFTSNP